MADRLGARPRPPRRHRPVSAALAALCALHAVSAVAGAAQESARVDYLTLANGAVPLRVGGAGAAQGANLSHAVLIVDGAPGRTSIVNRATDETDTEFVYELPALTTFERLAVPEVLETPSPSQTFMRSVEVHGSADGSDGPYALLAAGTLATHPEPGLETELDIVATLPVRWVKLRLVGGIEMLRDAMFLEFGEIVGNGHQESPPLSERFTGFWWERAVRLRLAQEGPAVTGCYDDGSPLTGTVTGNVLKARGVGRSDEVVSLFILGVTGDGAIRGVRSTNGAPFRVYTGGPAGPGRSLDCPGDPEPRLGCGSVLHGINFGFDSAEIREESAPVLELLAAGLAEEDAGDVLIEGHTSSEGDEAYNQELSERRAASVVDALAGLGADRARLRSAGRGETAPIAPNDDESGRAMNRRVEVHCTEGGR